MDFIKDKLDDVEDKVEEIVKKIKADDDFAKKFRNEPIKTVEALLEVDLPDEKLKALVSAVKAKINLDDMGKLLDSDGDGKPDLGAISKLGGLFGGNK